MKHNSKKQAERLAKNEAMQTLLNTNHKMRELGLKTSDINSRLFPALLSYKRERYEQAKEYAVAPIFTCIAI